MLSNTFSKKSICIIGAGRVGTTMAAVITDINAPEVKITAVCSKSSLSINKARKYIDNCKKNVIFSQDIKKYCRLCNCIMIATPDDSIRDTCDLIVNDLKKDAKEKLFINFSGAKTLDVFENALENGAQAVSLHPIKSFASIDESIKSIKGTVFGITYSENCDLDTKNFIDFLIGSLHGSTIVVDDDKKTAYHAAACVASNYLVALIDYAAKIHRTIGITEEDSLRGLMGLIEGTVSNIQKLGVKKSLTGPIARGDTGTITEHLRSFSETFKNKEEEQVYRVMGIETSRLAHENGWIDKKILDRFIKIFKET